MYVLDEHLKEMKEKIIEAIKGRTPYVEDLNLMIMEYRRI